MISKSMPVNSRRNFLKRIGGAAGFFVLSSRAFPFPNFYSQVNEFEMLVVGDSLVTGLGLSEKDKFYNLVKVWLEEEFFSKNRSVNLKNKSHSGSRLFLGEKEVAALNSAGKDPEEFYHPEINFSFPSTKTQLDIAAREYLSEGKRAEDVGLILVSGGLTNINVSEVIDPFGDNDELKMQIEEFCGDMMFRFLHYAATLFPNALITVIGYYPMVSKKSSTGEVYNAILELYKFPRFTKPLMNNILTKQFFKIFHSKTSKRSRIWAENSTKALRNAVERINEKTGKQTAVFVRSPVTEDRCFGTKNSLLFRMAKKGRSEDPLYDKRVEVCEPAIESLENVELKFRKRFCELSAIGHPNVEGSKAYADAITRILKAAMDV
ncbi:MAG: hypothetical protein R2681_10135 [Pyrinomonadaceae bacterium]